MSLASEAAALEAAVDELRVKVEALNVQPVVDSDTLATVLRQQGLLYEVCKLILQGRWQGEMPHAEAFIKAINPADADWSAVEFPRPNP